ncbi:hypothetical protein [Cytobacillus sp. NCCP-133]|uniref:hypothetical protein n=1 Tax=Cytobacillus sp. NCCP-133 TaxID=766848 RepID=UPI00222EE3B9|nr:hypothetical protein [Cytobacillus sp. NCCP-133]
MNSRPFNPYLLAGVGIASILLLASKNNRFKVQSLAVKMKGMIPDRFLNDTVPTEKLGHPDPHNIEDNKMVDEGAMYSVNYYNEKVQQ